MMDWRQLEQQESADRRARVEMQTDAAGHYRYVLSGWIDAAPEDEGALGDGVWTVEEISGIYGWKTPCRNDAARALRLRGVKS
ncbi:MULTISPECIES: hypothetical protein [Mameliella]|uniref:hypothetical protein n=1 Tax=Mameliella TaxID=1434019 RepID=UPI000B5376BF|nr:MULTISPECIES: hypothetical protein [Mameliella]MBY6122703.1 hypothetical protein [Mameliella alba]MCR9276060.1 hypothetical protein [Paracoccaceae bacterium]OWV37844.1 hypothetical protein CDZ95_27360 [Mameliella alba]OWV61578.1 hypothetical protein CDZ98_03485 [Mameliella alba]